MTCFQRHLRLPALAVATLVIASCGGGGGGSDDTTPTFNPVPLTTSNAKPVSAEILDSAETVQGASAGPAILTAVSVDASGSDFSFPEFVVQHLSAIQSLGIIPNSTVNGVVFGPDTVTCSGGGNWTITWNDADNDTELSVGDSITLAFSNCVETDVTVNGSMTMGITQISAGFTGFPPYILGVSVTLTNLSVVSSSHSASSNGDMSMLIADDGIGNENFDLSGGSLSSTVSGHSVTLTNYLYEFDLNDVTGAYSISLQGTLASTDIGGSVTYTTLVPFTGIDPGDPTAGQLHIVGAGGSQAWLTAEGDGINVSIEVDADGDGTAETFVPTTWTELESL